MLTQGSLAEEYKTGQPWYSKEIPINNGKTIAARVSMELLKYQTDLKHFQRELTAHIVTTASKDPDYSFKHFEQKKFL